MYIMYEASKFIHQNGNLLTKRHRNFYFIQMILHLHVGMVTFAEPSRYLNTLMHYV